MFMKWDEWNSLWKIQVMSWFCLQYSKNDFNETEIGASVVELIHCRLVQSNCTHAWSGSSFTLMKHLNNVLKAATMMRVRRWSLNWWRRTNSFHIKQMSALDASHFISVGHSSKNKSPAIHMFSICSVFFFFFYTYKHVLCISRKVLTSGATQLGLKTQRGTYRLKKRRQKRLTLDTRQTLWSERLNTDVYRTQTAQTSVSVSVRL